MVTQERLMPLPVFTHIRAAKLDTTAGRTRETKLPFPLRLVPFFKGSTKHKIPDQGKKRPCSAPLQALVESPPGLGSLWEPYRERDHFGTFLGPFWDHFGTILGPFWDRFGTILGHFETILGLVWDQFGPLWDHFGTIFPRPLLAHGLKGSS